MYIVVHDRLGRPQRIEVTRAVLYDDAGNPLALGVSHSKSGNIEQCFVSIAGEADFNQCLRNLGIDRTVVVEDLAQTPLRHVRFDG